MSHARPRPTRSARLPAGASSRRRSAERQLTQRTGPGGAGEPVAYPADAPDPMEYRDYYATLGRAAHGEPGRHQEGLPQARPASTTRTSTRATRAPNSASRRSTRPTRSCPIPRSASSTTSSAATGRQYQQAAPGAGAGGGDPFAGFAASSQAGRRVRFEYRGNAEDLAGFSDFFRTFFGGGVDRGRRRRRGAGTRTRHATGRASGVDRRPLRRDGPATRHGRAGQRPRRLRRRRLEAEAEMTLEEVARHQATARHRRQAPRSEHPAGRRRRAAHPLLRQGRRRRRVRQGQGRATSGVHPRRREPDARAADHACARRCWAARSRSRPSRARCCCASRPRRRTAGFPAAARACPISARKAGATCSSRSGSSCPPA